VYKTWRSRSAGDLSGAMLSAFGTGIVLWVVYGVAIDSLPVVSSNAVTLVLTAALLVLKIRYPS
jgi:MtN3 and saliva related transmembrane protein